MFIMFLSFEYIMWKILFVVLFTCYFIVKDTFFWECPSFLGKLIFIIHHMITTAVLFSGPLFGFYYFHIFLLLSTMASWIFLKKCFVSMYHNYLCENKGETFQNLGYVTRSYIHKKTGIKIHFMYEMIILILLLVYNIYMIAHRYA